MRSLAEREPCCDEGITSGGVDIPQLACSLETISNAGNQGHGPSLMTAYGRALEGKPDFVLQVDGDGQFHGSPTIIYCYDRSSRTRHQR